ncbi:MAG TPA: type II toxin-antitoxin system HicA family toxin [Anaerolineae bacterium]|nr:type II toxin-antitoxin system HicA family toxin [Anaerolineae bacterium]HQI87690.1 type II toxin-antitoxin system HicA family toxin [Anaerolineae bacterium]
MKYREVTQKLRALGCEELARRSGGSHRKWYNPATDQMASLPDWGSKDIKIGTLRAVVRQLGLDWEAFRNA